MNILGFLFIGWVLSWFKFDKLFVQAIKELINRDITKATYYFLFFCLGLLADLILIFNGGYGV